MHGLHQECQIHFTSQASFDLKWAAPLKLAVHADVKKFKCTFNPSDIFNNKTEGHLQQYV